MSTPTPAARYLDACDELAFLLDDGPGFPGTEGAWAAWREIVEDARTAKRESMFEASLRLMPFPCP